jgi:hypothetical protein
MEYASFRTIYHICDNCIYDLIIKTNSSFITYTFTNVYGVVCKGCDQNICENNGNFENSKINQDQKTSRGDIPEMPKFDNQFLPLIVQWIVILPLCVALETILPLIVYLTVVLPLCVEGHIIFMPLSV